MREECTSFAEKLTGLFSDIVVKTMTVQLLRELDELDVTLSQLQALSRVAERRNCSVGSVAEGLGVTHPAAVKLVDKLVKKGLVTRGVAAADHRQAEIAITDEGRRLVHAVRQERTQRLERVLEQMEPEERQALIQGLQGFVTAALRDEGALDQLCVSCQALLPTDCDDFRQRAEVFWAEPVGRV
jgi:MarR family transcriptional regulator, negative regulator of the multidrug operon emrRAB